MRGPALFILAAVLFGLAACSNPFRENCRYLTEIVSAEEVPFVEIQLRGDCIELPDGDFECVWWDCDAR